MGRGIDGGERRGEKLIWVEKPGGFVKTGLCGGNGEGEGRRPGALVGRRRGGDGVGSGRRGVGSEGQRGWVRDERTMRDCGWDRAPGIEWMGWVGNDMDG
jgi:hypothetical protein